MSDPAVPVLRQLYAYLTEGCNLACRHCYLAPKRDPTGERTVAERRVEPVKQFPTGGNRSTVIAQITLHFGD